MKTAGALRQGDFKGAAGGLAKGTGQTVAGAGKGVDNTVSGLGDGVDSTVSSTSTAQLMIAKRVLG